MSDYPLMMEGAIREWRIGARRVFDIVVRPPVDEFLPDSPPKRTARLVHTQSFSGPATGPVLCYRRQLAPTEDPVSLFGGVDEMVFGGRSGRSIGPVGLGLIDAVQSVPVELAREPLEMPARLLGEAVPSVEFLHAAAMVRPLGLHAVMVHAMLADRAEEVFVWVLAHKQEHDQAVMDYVRHSLHDEGLNADDELVEYIGLPYMHPVGLMQQAFELTTRRSKR